MPAQRDNTNRGFIGKNKKQRAGTKDPDLTGVLNVDGREYWLSGWKNDKGYGLAVKPKESRPSSYQRPQPQSTGGFDDEEPF